MEGGAGSRETYQAQLKLIEQALVVQPHNPQLLQAQKDLLELLQLCDQLDKQQQAKEELEQEEEEGKGKGQEEEEEQLEEEEEEIEDEYEEDEAEEYYLEEDPSSDSDLETEKPGLPQQIPFISSGVHMLNDGVEVPDGDADRCTVSRVLKGEIARWEQYTKVQRLLLLVHPLLWCRA